MHVYSLTEAMKPELLITFYMNYTISIFMPAHRYGRMKLYLWSIYEKHQGWASGLGHFNVQATVGIDRPSAVCWVSYQSTDEKWV